MKNQKRFSDIKKQALKLYTVSRKAMNIPLDNESTIEKAKCHLAEIIEDLQDLISNK